MSNTSNTVLPMCDEEIPFAAVKESFLTRVDLINAERKENGPKFSRLAKGMDDIRDTLESHEVAISCTTNATKRIEADLKTNQNSVLQLALSQEALADDVKSNGEARVVLANELMSVAKEHLRLCQRIVSVENQFADYAASASAAAVPVTPLATKPVPDVAPSRRRRADSDIPVEDEDDDDLIPADSSFRARNAKVRARETKRLKALETRTGDLELLVSELKSVIVNLTARIAPPPAASAAAPAAAAASVEPESSRPLRMTFSCIYCPKTFKYEGVLTKHIMNKHPFNHLSGSVDTTTIPLTMSAVDTDTDSLPAIPSSPVVPLSPLSGIFDLDL